MTRSLRRSALFLMLLPLLAAPLAAASQWVPLGPFGGTITRLAGDPVDSRVVYATLVYATTYWENALFKTTDGGDHWRQIHSMVGDLAMDPSRHDILYMVDSSQSQPGRLMKSVNGGVSWAAMNLPDSVYCVATDPAQPSLVYVAGGSGIWRSTDRGASWQPAAPLPSGGAKRLIAAGQPAGRVFAITGNGMFKSVDAGRTWSIVSLPLDGQELGVFAVSSQRLYASFGNDLYRSTDGGATWRQALQRTIGGSPISLTISARSPRTLWLGTSGGLLRSTDAGDTWTAVGPGQPVTAIAIAPSSPLTLYAGLRQAGTDAGGLFASTDGGGTWTRRNHGLTGLDVGALALDPGNPGILWVAHSGGLYRSTNAGAGWKRIALAPIPPSQALPVFGIVVDPVTPSTVYLLSSALWRTQDGGSSWTNLSATGAPALHLLLINPRNPRQLWGIAEGWLYASADEGDHWSRLKLPATFHCGIGGFAVAPTSPPTLYLSGAEGDLEDICWDWAYPVFFRSTNGGATWTDLSQGLRNNRFDGPGPIAIDPVDPRLLYIGTDAQYKYNKCDGVWKSGDGGTTWARAGRDLGCVYAVAASPVAGVVWASTDDARVFRSGDFGATWKRRATGLLTDRIYDLAISPADPQRVYAATSSGVWMWDETP